MVGLKAGKATHVGLENGLNIKIFKVKVGGLVIYLLDLEEISSPRDFYIFLLLNFFQSLITTSIKKCLHINTILSQFIWLRIFLCLYLTLK